MKKIILSIVLALAIIFSCVCPAFAADNDAWVLHKDAEYITHDGVKYLPIYDLKISVANYRGYEFVTIGYTEIDLEFDSIATESIYHGAYVNVYGSNSDSVVEAYIPSYGYVLYVSEDYMLDFSSLRHGYLKDFKIKNQYGISGTLSQEHYFDALYNSVRTSSVSDKDYDWIDFYCVDYNNDISCIVGAVLRSKTTGKIYLLRYSDYNTSYFFADGQLDRNNTDRTKMYTLYEVEDTKVIEYINSIFDALPEDGLDWLAGIEPGKLQKIISAIVFLGVLPLAILVLCLIALIKSKRKFYRVPLITLIASSAVLIISAIILYFF